jgi:hypothetical protein
MIRYHKPRVLETIKVSVGTIDLLVKSIFTPRPHLAPVIKVITNG